MRISDWSSDVCSSDLSIAWGIAKTLAAHGAELAFTYQGEAFVKRVKPLVASIGAKLVMPCDVEDEKSLDDVFATLKTEWRSVDFIVHAVAFSDRKSTRLNSSH